MLTWQPANMWSANTQIDCALKVLAEAGQVDDRAAAGEDIGPLCGLAILVKDLYDVANYTTAAGTPALEGGSLIYSIRRHHEQDVSACRPAVL